RAARPLPSDSFVRECSRSVPPPLDSVRWPDRNLPTSGQTGGRGEGQVARLLRKDSGLVNAQGRWLVAAKVRIPPSCGVSACGVRSSGRLDLFRSKVLPARRIDPGRVTAPQTRMATGARGTELSGLHMIVLGRIAHRARGCR